MKRSLKRSSGYIKLDVVVRGCDSITNTIDYAIRLPNGEIAWMNGENMGVGATREAKIIFEEIYR